jgi:hypothetical protein
VCAWPAPHLANFHHSHALGLRLHQCLEHIITYGVRPRPLHPWSTPPPRSLCPRCRSIASPSTSTTSPGARRRLRPQSMLSTSTASPRARRRLRPRSTPSTSTALLEARRRPRLLRRCPRPCAFDTLDHVLRLTLCFPSPQVIHEELVNYCRILSSSTKIELPGHSGS